MENPYLPPAPLQNDPQNDHATLLRGGFLFREIQFYQPVEFRFRYSGWNFIQRIYANEHIVWSRISWVVIHRQAEFRLPQSLDASGATYRMNIEFGRGLRTRHFLLFRGTQLIWEDWGDKSLAPLRSDS